MPTPTKPILYCLAGLPGSGKSTLGQRLAAHVGAIYLRIDTIEQALRDLCAYQVEGEGYRLSYRVAADNLRLGLGVVADSCNPIALSRDEWERVARDEGAHCVHLEIVCSDPAEHRLRVETREVSVPGLRQPTWEDVVQREYHSWTRERIQIDTVGQSVEESWEQIVQKLSLSRHTLLKARI